MKRTVGNTLSDCKGSDEIIRTKTALTTELTE
jgi:hypothetical protein